MDDDTHLDRTTLTMSGSASDTEKSSVIDSVVGNTLVALRAVSTPESGMVASEVRMGEYATTQGQSCSSFDCKQQICRDMYHQGCPRSVTLIHHRVFLPLREKESCLTESWAKYACGSSDMGGSISDGHHLGE